MWKLRQSPTGWLEMLGSRGGGGRPSPGNGSVCQWTCALISTYLVVFALCPLVMTTWTKPPCYIVGQRSGLDAFFHEHQFNVWSGPWFTQLSVAIIHASLLAKSPVIPANLYNRRPIGRAKAKPPPPNQAFGRVKNIRIHYANKMGTTIIIDINTEQ